MAKPHLKLVQLISTGAILIALSFTGAQAQSVQLLCDFKDWSAYSTSQSNGKLCFVLSKPKSVTPEPENYEQSYIYLTHRPSENIKYEFNFVAGFTFAVKSEAKLIIGGQSYELFTKDDAAWLADREKSKDVAGQMRAGSSMNIAGMTKDNINIVQTFSLSGVTAASRSIDRACN
ncbi:MAG: invasion associated locus B family protein [Devosiaceae bacterium]|nr:invasion associated locus B family protein [Devosiaceae bacterium]